MRQHSWAKQLSALGVLVALAACSQRNPVFSGTIHTEASDVGSTVGGRVVRVLVSAGQYVRAGQVLVTLDADSAHAVVRQAQANYAKVATAQSSQIKTAEAQVRSAQSAVTQAAAAYDLAEKNYERYAALGASGDVARQTVDQARSTRDQAQAALAGANEQVARAQAQLTEIERAQAPNDPKAAAAAVAAARVNLDEGVVRSPVDGYVESLDLQPGDILAPRAVAATIDAMRDPYVRIYVPQQYLSTFARGRHVIVRSDALPGQTFEGIDEEHDRTAQFTPRDVETAEDRAELTFGIKIRIHDPKHQLYGGTTATVSTQ